MNVKYSNIYMSNIGKYSREGKKLRQKFGYCPEWLLVVCTYIQLKNELITSIRTNWSNTY